MQRNVITTSLTLGLLLISTTGVAPAAEKALSFKNSIGMEFVSVPAGSFVMGRDGAFDDVKPPHKVTISKDFYIGKYEVTQAQWKAVMGNHTSKYKGIPDFPVDEVNWIDVQVFIKKLSIMEGKNYRLPTEAEWEYACRSGGKDQQYCGGDEADEVAWYIRNSNMQPQVVGTKKPNGLGIYDMSGNVEEWCEDWYHEDYYAQSPNVDPPGAAGGTRPGSDTRVVRGSSWRSPQTMVESSFRFKSDPEYKGTTFGFRLVASVSSGPGK